MQNWDTVEIGEIIKVTSGGTPSRKKPEYYHNGNVPWVKTGDLKEKELYSASEFISEDGLKNSSAKLFPPDTVLIALYGATIGACSILKIEAATNQACAALLPSKKIDPKYLFYFLVHHKPKLIAAGVGGAQSNISGQIIKSTTIPLPPLPTQRRIAAILDKADALRRKDRELLDKYDELVQAVFLEMFGDPVKNPKNIEKRKLDEFIIHLTSGGRGWSKYYSDSGARFIRSYDVQMNEISEEEIVHVSPPDNRESQRTRVNPKDVLLTVTGSKIGRVAVAPNDLGETYVSQHVAIIRTHKISPYYLSFFLSLENGGQHLIRKNQYGQTKPGLKFDQIRGFEIPVPPIEMQRKFSNAMENIEAQKAKVRQQITQSEALFQSLLQRAFRGELAH